MIMHQLILIERDSFAYSSWPGLIKHKKIFDLSVKEVIDCYQGFQGELVSCYEVRDIGELKNKLDEYIEYEQIGKCFILHLLSAPTGMPTHLQTRATKLGYDVGFCDCEEEAIYSSIFHEVLFGNINELVSYKDLLNENFLFTDQFLAEKYIATHNEMSAQGKDVEDITEMIIYEIWKRRID